MLGHASIGDRKGHYCHDSADSCYVRSQHEGWPELRTQEAKRLPEVVRIYHALTGTTTETKADYTLWPPQPATCGDVLRDRGDVGPCVLSGRHGVHDDGAGVTWTRSVI
jgi:hypothetical protein